MTCGRDDNASNFGDILLTVSLLLRVRRCWGMGIKKNHQSSSSSFCTLAYADYLAPTAMSSASVPSKAVMDNAGSSSSALDSCLARDHRHSKKPSSSCTKCVLLIRIMKTMLLLLRMRMLMTGNADDTRSCSLLASLDNRYLSYDACIKLCSASLHHHHHRAIILNSDNSSFSCSLCSPRWW